MLRKPLVIVNGQFQQLQAGDTLDATVGAAQELSLTNGNAGTINIGMAVYISAADTVDLAKADAAATKDVIGLVKDTTIAAAASGTVVLDGVLVATTGQWDAVTGDTGGLTPGSKYWLDPTTAGSITKTAPTTVGKYVVPLGKAISTTEFMIDIEEPVLL
jgi:hypothetical protein